MTLKPSQLEFKNRIGEIINISPENVTEEKDVQNFVDKIVNLVDFVESDDFFKKRIEELHHNTRLDDAERDLLKQGDKLTDYCRKLYKQAERIVGEKKINLPTEREVIERHVNKGAYSPTVTESLGENLDRVKRSLTKENLSVQDVESMANELLRSTGDLKSFEIDQAYTDDEVDELIRLSEMLKNKREAYERLRRQLGITDYETIKGVWEWQNDENNITSGSMGFRFSPIGFMLSHDDAVRYQINDIQKSVRKYRDVVQSLEMRIKETESKYENTWYRKVLRGLYWLIKWLLSKIHF